MGDHDDEVDDDESVEEQTQPVRIADVPGLARAMMGSKGKSEGVSIRTEGAFSVGSILWRDANGRLSLTIVAKLGYELSPGLSSPLAEPPALQVEDGHWDDDPKKSVHVPGDLAPFKAAAEVVVVGSAFAPADRAAPSATARVVVGSVDKAVVAWAPRVIRADGSVEEAPKQVRFSLRWERAAGGPETDNPAGIDAARADLRGRRSIPELLPPGFELGRTGEFVPTVGLGPIAARWRQRAGYLGELDRAWLREMRHRPLPPGFPARYFQAAPMDQWLDRPLSANERLVLEGLHDSVPRLVTSLPGIEPWAVIVGSSAEPIRLSGDLLVIDSDHALATLTFRATVGVEEGREIGAVILEAEMGSPPPPEAVQRARGPATRPAPPPPARSANLPPAREPASAPPHVEAPPHEEDWSELTNVETVTGTNPGVPAPPLPFARTAAKAGSSVHPDGGLPFAPAGAQPPPPRPSYPDGALPFAAHAGATTAVPAPRPSRPGEGGMPFAPPPRPSQSESGLPFRASPSQPPAAPVTFGPPPAPSAPAPALTFGPPPAPIGFPPPSFGAQVVAPPPLTIGQQALDRASSSIHVPSLLAGAAPPLGAASAPAVSAPAASSRSLGSLRAEAPAAMSAIADKVAPPAMVKTALAGTALAASDAAAAAERAAENAAQRSSAPQARAEGPVRLAIVDLIAAEPGVARRLRLLRRFSTLLAMPQRTKLQSIDEPRREMPEAERDRADILRVLCYGRPDGVSQVRDVLAESLEEGADLDTPLVIAAGDLRPTFDEVDTLKATVSVAQSIAGNDKRMLAAIALGQEATAGAVGPRPDAALGLARQIGAAAVSLSLPPDYVATQVERVLIEGRKYKRRILRGGTKIRADLVLRPGGDVLPAYLADEVAAALPLLGSCPVITISEVRLREDVAEAQSEALFPVAIGRVLHLREV